MRPLGIAILAVGVAWGSAERGAPPHGGRRVLDTHPEVPRPAPARNFTVVVLPAALRGMMSAVWVSNNLHWDELAGVNTLTQMLGTVRPTQREYLGCLAGDVANDTLWVRQLIAAADLKQLQFAVAGNCDHVDRFVGTWHTHPYRAAPDGRALKERALSATDLATFASTSWELVTFVMWDLDSLDVAAKGPGGSVRHPGPLAVR